MDPLLINRPADDAGIRAVLDRMNQLSERLTELGAMVSQITSTTQDATITPWSPPSAYADAVAITLPKPSWAESVIILASGHVGPKFDTSAGSQYCYARLRVASKSAGVDTVTYSPDFFTWLAAMDTLAGLSWPVLIRNVSAPVVVATQAYAPTGVTVAGGSASVSATALWMR